jgi:hypothetical protein
MKLANPLFYPLSVLVGGIALVVGIRGLNLSSPVMIPVAATLTMVGAKALKSREPDPEKLLQQKLQALMSTGQALSMKAQGLRQEASQRLGQELAELELLTSVQFACDRALEIPSKIAHFIQQLQSHQGLVLSVPELQQQLQEVRLVQQASSGLARQQFDQLVQSLERNLALAQEGQDTSVAQIAGIELFIQNSAGLLQKFQNELRMADLKNPQQIQKLQQLSEDLGNLCDNANHLILES